MKDSFLRGYLLLLGITALLFWPTIQLSGQLNLIHNGGFDQLCPHGEIHIDGVLASEKSDSNFFIGISPLSGRGNTAPRYWSCNSDIDNGSYFWFQKNETNIDFYAQIFGYAQFNKRQLKHKSKEITGLLKRPLVKGETVTLNVWTRFRSPYNISNQNLRCYFSTDISSSNPDTLMNIRWDEISVVREDENSVFINYHGTYYSRGKELYLTLKVPELYEDDFDAKDYKLIRKKTKNNKKKGRNVYNYLEVKIDSVFVSVAYDSLEQIAAVKPRPNVDVEALIAKPKNENNISSLVSSNFPDTVLVTRLYFDTDVSEINKTTLAKLKSQVTKWKDKNQEPLTFIVNGFTDFKGSEESNFQLSLNRAKTAADYLGKIQNTAIVRTGGLGKCLECEGAKCRRVDIYLTY